MAEMYDQALILEAVKLCPDDNQKAIDMLLNGEVQNIMWERQQQQQNGHHQNMNGVNQEDPHPAGSQNQTAAQQ